MKEAPEEAGEEAAEISPDLPAWLFWFSLAMLAALGLAIGSFLNVCIWRMPRDMSVVRPPSHCPACNARLRPRDLVPVLSFLLQGRRCRYCQAPISWRYAVVESITAVAFVLLGLTTGLGVALLFDAVLVATLIAIFAIDLEHYIIPDQLNLVVIGTGVARDVWGLATGSGSFAARLPVPGTAYEVPIPASVVGLAVGYGLFLALGWLGSLAFKQEAMGGGDLLLAAGLGAHLGWIGAVASFLLAVALGAGIGLLLMAAGRKKRREYIPFGPFMVLGALAVVYAGQWLVPALMDLYYLGSGGPVPTRSWPVGS